MNKCKAWRAKVERSTTRGTTASGDERDWPSRIGYCVYAAFACFLVILDAGYAAKAPTRLPTIAVTAKNLTSGFCPGPLTLWLNFADRLVLPEDLNSAVVTLEADAERNVVQAEFLFGVLENGEFANLHLHDSGFVARTELIILDSLLANQTKTYEVTFESQRTLTAIAVEAGCCQGREARIKSDRGDVQVTVTCDSTIAKIRSDVITSVNVLTPMVIGDLVIKPLLWCPESWLGSSVPRHSLNVKGNGEALSDLCWSLPKPLAVISNSIMAKVTIALEGSDLIARSGEPRSSDFAPADAVNPGPELKAIVEIKVIPALRRIELETVRQFKTGFYNRGGVPYHGLDFSGSGDSRFEVQILNVGTFNVPLSQPLFVEKLYDDRVRVVKDLGDKGSGPYQRVGDESALRGWYQITAKDQRDDGIVVVKVSGGFTKTAPLYYQDAFGRTFPATFLSLGEPGWGVLTAFQFRANRGLVSQPQWIKPGEYSERLTVFYGLTSEEKDRVILDFKTDPEYETSFKVTTRK